MADLRHSLAALLEDQEALGLDGLPIDAKVLQALRAGPAVSVSPAPVVQAPSPSPVVQTPSPVVQPPSPSPVIQAPASTLVTGGSLQAIREELGDCTRCKLSKGRKNIVFGVGNPSARLMFVGEGPGADEDVQGEPFVGKAGQLLTKMIEAMGLARKDVYIANVVKCRPPNNRDPEPDEVAACEPFLVKQLGAVNPQMIVTLGKHAAHTLLRDQTAISRLRGKWKTYQGIKLMPTFHPSYLLRDPSQKKLAWADLQEVMRELGLKRPSA